MILRICPNSKNYIPQRVNFTVNIKKKKSTKIQREPKTMNLATKNKLDGRCGSQVSRLPPKRSPKEKDATA